MLPLPRCLHPCPCGQPCGQPVAGSHPAWQALASIRPSGTRLCPVLCPRRPQVYAGGVPNQVASMIQRQLATLRSRRGGLLTKLLLAAGSAAALAAGLAWRMGYLGGGGAAGGAAGRNLSEELRTLGERIRLAQKRKL